MGARDRYPWELLVLLWLANFLNQGDRQIFNALLPLIRSGLGATDVQMGLVATAFTLCYGVLVPVAGWLGDRASRKNIVRCSLLVFSAGTLLTGLSGGLVSLIVFRGFATGVGESFYTPAALSLIGSHHRDSRGVAMSINQTSQYVGVIGSSWLAAWLAQSFGWRAAFGVFGTCGLALAGVMMWRLRSDGGANGGEVRSAAPRTRDTLRLLLRNPTVLLISAGFACMVFATTGFMTWMPTLLFEKFRLPLAKAAFQAVFLHYLFAFAGVLIGGWWSDRRATERPVFRLHIGAFGLFASAPFIVLLGQAGTLGMVQVALALFGLFRGIYDSNIFASLYEVAPARLRSTATGLMIAFAYVTGAAAPLGLGFFKTRFGLDHGMSLLALFYLLGALLLAIGAFCFFARDRRHALAGAA